MLDQIVLSQTDKVKHDKVFRLQKQIESRKDYFIGAVTYSEARNDRSQIDKLRQFCTKCDSLYNRLVNIYNNYQHYEYLEIYREVKSWGNRKDHLVELFNIHQATSRNLDSTLSWILDYLSESAKESSIQITKERLRLEFYDKVNKKWFMVFSTLTVDPEYYNEVFRKGSDCWRNYIRTIERKVAKSCYGSYRKAKGKEYFKYFAVVEEGGETDRLHIHVVMFMKHHIEMIDPNIGLAIPDKREIKCLCHLWQYGFSTHTPVRFNNSDAWGLLQWRWSVQYNEETNNYQPIDNSTIGKMQGYLIKYVMKSKKIKLEGEVYSWKIKMTKDLGKTQLIQVIQKLNNKELTTLIAPRAYPDQIKVYDEPIPSKLVRSIAVKELMKRNPYLQVLPKDTTLQTLLKSTTRKKNDRNSQSFGNSILQLLKNKVIFDVILFYKVKKKIEAWFYTESDVSEHGGANLKGEA